MFRRRKPTVGAVLCVTLMCAPAIAQDASRLPFENPAPEAPHAALKAGANSFIESQARQLLESKGYSDVSRLVNDSTGIWHGTARKNDRQVEVSIDFQGHIAEK